MDSPPTVTSAADVSGSIAELADGHVSENTVTLYEAGHFTISDANNDSVTVSSSLSSTTHGSGSAFGALTAEVSDDTDDGSGQISWTYSVADSALDALGDSDSYTETWVVTVNDGTEDVTQNITITINGTNDEPTSANNTVTTLEDNNYVFQASDFGFSDPDTGDALSRISVESLPTDGVLRFTNDGTNWQDVSAGGTFTKAMIDAGRLRFEPASNENGDAYASFTFKVNDGTANSADAYTITVDVDPDTHKVVDHSTMVEISTSTNFASGSGGDGYETGKIHIVKESINVAPAKLSMTSQLAAPL